jgi:hypothetical protein
MNGDIRYHEIRWNVEFYTFLCRPPSSHNWLPSTKEGW